MVIGLLLSVFLIATLASYFADFIKRHQWLGYLGLFVILIIALQLIIGGLVNYEVLSINEKFKFLIRNMIDFCILGSGIAGSTIANLLSKKYSVHVFDKARGPGGRSSNKRFKNNLSFDHGVQYISPKSKLFTKYVQKLHKNKILKIGMIII